MAAPRTLLLAPPSISAHPEVLDKVYEIHDRSSADLQMLDRLAAGLVQLPASTYDVVLLLTDAHGTTRESHKLLGRDVMSKIAAALKPGGYLRSQDGVFGAAGGAEKTEAILAGLVEGSDGMTKSEDTGSVSIPLKLRKKANGVANGTTNGTANGNDAVPLNLNGKRKEPEPVKPVGVGFVDFSDDLDDPIITGEDDDLIDEDDLITEEDMARPVIQRKLLACLGNFRNSSNTLCSS
ncbi:hypothetical protein DM02DRAFT_615745 [Periconia macrospinosa]|uniref:Fe-S cluster assembly protein Dre2 N-terminal domain-containing protein n=1 Tax=Periconia macrospinosa TaxID=97972 RepID=A0A2V1DLL4_9PLEO|nr:hypothetical protein DM02DRAFT_615745 [Periconia macrospinosa]